MKKNVLVIVESGGPYYWAYDCAPTKRNEARALFNLGRQDVHVVTNPTWSNVAVDKLAFEERKRWLMGMGRFVERVLMRLR